MRLLFTFIIASLCLVARGDIFTRYQNQWTTVYTNVTFSSNITANVSFTNTQATALSVNHTFQLVNNSAGTNTTVAALDRTIDQVNWFNVNTNTFTNNTVSEYAVSGKWTAYRWRIYAQATNSVMTGLYMAQ